MIIIAYFLEPSDTDNAGEMPENTMVQPPGKNITSFNYIKKISMMLHRYIYCTTYLAKQRMSSQCQVKKITI